MRVGKLGSVNVLLADTEYELYTLTDTNAFSVVTVHGVNRGIAPVKLNIGIKNSVGDIYWLENGVEILQKNVLVRSSVNLSTGDTIVCSATADQVNFVCTGSQSSDGVGTVSAPVLQSVDTIIESSPTASNLFGTSVSTTDSFFASSAPGAGTVQVKTAEGSDLISVVNSVTNNASDDYGDSIAVNDFYLVVGAPGEIGTGGEANAGKVYIYETFSGSLLFTLVSPNEAVDKRFGATVLIDSTNNKLYVGEPTTDNLGVGAVYRYTLSTGAYDNLSAAVIEAGGFGASLALNNTGSTLYVGIPERNSGAGGYHAINASTMVPGSIVLPSGGTYNPIGMGTSIASDGIHTFVGGPQSIIVETGQITGLVQVFNSSGNYVTDIEPPADYKVNGVKFGTSIAVNSELVIVGAPGHDSNTGIAFAYLNTAPAFDQVANIDPPSTDTGEFGASADASNSKIVLGAPESTVSSQTNAGAVYTFREKPTAFQSRNITATLVLSSTSIDQGSTITAVFEVDLPYSSNSGYDFSWAIGGFSSVVATAGVTGNVSTTLSGTATTDSNGRIAFTINTKDSSALDYFSQGNQIVTLTVGGVEQELTVVPSPPELYAFTAHTFTNAGQTGRSGPTITTVRSAYSSAAWRNDYLDMEVNGFQLWTVPADATYRIDVRSASGQAYSSNSRRGYGYRVRGEFALSQGDILEMAVGQGGHGGGGSGGGSFVILRDGSQRTPLIIAGGGGAQDGRYSHTNGDGHAGESGKSSSDGYAGGSNGQGGTSGGGGNGGGGGGLLGNGTNFPNNGGGGYIQSGNLSSGTVNSNSLYGGNPNGGFGGGGGSTDDQGSGGGGYSGGAYTNENSTGGAGGTYFNTTYGSSRTNVGQTSDTHGQIIITKL